MSEPPSSNHPTHDPAMLRYFALAGSRIAGSAVMVGGIIIIARDDMADLRIAGYAIVALGFVLMAYLPRALAKRWRTPPTL